MLSVVLPLADARGDAAGHLRSWTHGQTLARDRYQVVVATGGGDPDAEQAVADALAPHDVLARVPGAGDWELWSVGAARASAPWLVISEGHCLADPGCLAAVLRAIEVNPQLQAAMLEIGHWGESRAQRMLGWWFDEVFAGWAREDWGRLHFAGSVIRRDLFERVGGVESQYGLFCVPMLSIRLAEAGAEIGRIPGAKVQHVHNDTLREHHDATADYVGGELDARAANSPVLCERYIGHTAVWTDQLRYRPEVARRVARVVGSAAMRAVTRRPSQVPVLTADLARWLSRCWISPRSRAAIRRVDFLASELAAQHLPLPTRWRRRAFLRAHARVVALTRLEVIANRARPLAAVPRACGSWGIEHLGPDTLVGAYALERTGANLFRWTHPVMVLRLAPPPGDHQLVVETGGLRGDPLDYVTEVYVGRHPVPRAALGVEDGRLTVDLPADRAEAAATGGAVFVARPWRPSRTGSPDPRRLGMPLAAVEIRPTR